MWLRDYLKKIGFYYFSLSESSAILISYSGFYGSNLKILSTENISYYIQMREWKKLAWLILPKTFLMSFSMLNSTMFPKD